MAIVRTQNSRLAPEASSTSERSLAQFATSRQTRKPALQICQSCRNGEPQPGANETSPYGWNCSRHPWLKRKNIPPSAPFPLSIQNILRTGRLDLVGRRDADSRVSRLRSREVRGRHLLKIDEAPGESRY